jgi:hypothetical protein
VAAKERPFCPGCGQPTASEDAFYSSCEHRLATSSAARRADEHQSGMRPGIGERIGRGIGGTGGIITALLMTTVGVFLLSGCGGSHQASHDGSAQSGPAKSPAERVAYIVGQEVKQHLEALNHYKAGITTVSCKKRDSVPSMGTNAVAFLCTFDNEPAHAELWAELPMDHEEPVQPLDLTAEQELAAHGEYAGVKDGQSEANNKSAEEDIRHAETEVQDEREGKSAPLSAEEGRDREAATTGEPALSTPSEAPPTGSSPASTGTTSRLQSPGVSGSTCTGGFEDNGSPASGKGSWADITASGLSCASADAVVHEYLTKSYAGGGPVAEITGGLRCHTGNYRPPEDHESPVGYVMCSTSAESVTFEGTED